MTQPRRRRGPAGLLRDVRRRARDRLPARAVTGIKSALLLWGMATASRRQLPSFLVVGAQRAGTTTLFRALSDHPELFRPTLSKGIGYFDLEHRRGMRWYRGHFPLTSTVRRRSRRRGQTFESSGYYAFHPLAAARIAAELPGVRVVLVVRDPVERAFSAWKHESRRGFEDLDFASAVHAEDGRLEGEVERLLAEPGYRSLHHRHHAYRGRGRYGEQVRRLQAELGPDHVHVLDADDFFADPEQELGRLFDWLGVARAPLEVGRWNATDPGALDPALRAELRGSFEESDTELAELTGRTPSWRRTPPLEG